MAMSLAEIRYLINRLSGLARRSLEIGRAHV